MARLLAELSLDFRPQAVELLARLTEARIPVLITATGRSATEQAEAVRTGHSKVQHSRHQDGEAIDLVLYETWKRAGTIGTPTKLDWDPFRYAPDGKVVRDHRGAKQLEPEWAKLVEIVQRLGLRSGATFGETYQGALDGWDCGHAERPCDILPPIRSA